MTLLMLLQGETRACTSAIVSAQANPYGRPLLWKHRDTSAADNKVEYIPASDGKYAYTALFNSKDKRNEQAWIGMNEVGFAVMNTASYNIKDDNVAKALMDREGYVMARALQTCRTVDDFEELLKALPRPMGVEANFGVIDAAGNGAYFETNNHSYKRFNLSDAANGVLIRTNYCHSGRPGAGKGYIREANAEYLIGPYAAKGEVTPELLTETVSRSFYHDGKKTDFTTLYDSQPVDGDFIPRFTSTSTIVIEGCRPVEDVSLIQPGDLNNEYIMWTGMGYPPCAEIYAVRCTPDGVPTDLRGNAVNGHSPAGDKANGRKNKVFLTRKGDKKRYVVIKKLYNAEGTGYSQILREKNLEVYKRERQNRDNN